MIGQWLAIAAGGAAGATARFWLSTMVYTLFGRQFPYGTLAVNLIGSFLMGLLFVLFTERMVGSTELRALILIGFLGAFTTFSTFSLETLQLIEQSDLLKASLNILLSVLLCLFACWLGLLFGRQLGFR